MSIYDMIDMVNSVKKILISISNNSIVFSYKTNNSSISNDLINTNIISNNELIFSDIYISENTKILSSFLKELGNLTLLKAKIFSNHGRMVIFLSIFIF